MQKLMNLIITNHNLAMINSSLWDMLGEQVTSGVKSYENSHIAVFSDTKSHKKPLSLSSSTPENLKDHSLQEPLSKQKG